MAPSHSIATGQPLSSAPDLEPMAEGNQPAGQPITATRRAAGAQTETLGTFLQQLVQRHGSRPALLFKPRYRTDAWSYRRLWDESSKVAAWLDERGIAKGERVVLWAPNSPWWVAVFFGCARRGVVLVPLDVRSGPDFARRVVGQTEPRLAILSMITAGTWEQEIPTIRIEDLAQLPMPATEVTSQVGPGDIAEVIFTSGTTGDPKGVMLTHSNILANVASVNPIIPNHPQFRLLSILPLSHMFEQTVGLLLPLRRGGSVYYPLSRQSTMLFRDLKEQSITTILAVPQALHLFMAAIEREVKKQGKEQQWRMLLQVAEHLPQGARRLLFRDVHRRLGGTLSFIASGGAPLDPALIHAWELLGIPVVQGYGATEASPVITATGLENRNPRSVGKAAPGVEIKLAADGEVLARGPNITPGYWRNEAATAAAIEGGWYHTGDLGELDAQGYLYLRGRKKDLIVLANGQNVFPEDVEAVLRQMAGVTDVAVLGVPGPQGTRVHAVLLCEGPVDAGALMRQANGKLAAHQQIQDITVWPEADFPRTHTLKIRKQELLKALLERQSTLGQTGATAATSAPMESGLALARTIAEAAGIPLEKVIAGAALGDDLGLDSLGRVELLAAIEEQRGVYLDETLVGPATTVGELEALVAAQQSTTRPNFPRWPLSAAAGMARRVCQRGVFKLLDRLAPSTVSGMEVLQTLKPPVLFVANHVSHADSPVILQALPPRWRRRVAVAAAADYFFTRKALGATVALLLNAFAFSRDTSIRPTLEHCAWLLDHGWSILLYPEGRRSDNGDMGPFKGGVGLLAVELGVPVVPIYIDGLYEVLPKGRFLPRKGRVGVRFGEALRFPTQTAYTEASASIEQAVRSLGVEYKA